MGTDAISWGIKWPGRKFGHLPLPLIEIKNEESYISTPFIFVCGLRRDGSTWYLELQKQSEGCGCIVCLCTGTVMNLLVPSRVAEILNN